MCHQTVAPRHTTTVGGRMLCFGCVSGWFEDGDEEGNDADRDDANDG
jgi:hypothetical protein